MKEGGDNLASQVVTEIDIEAQNEILAHLTPTFQQYQLGLLTEESVDDRSRFDNDYSLVYRPTGREHFGFLVTKMDIVLQLLLFPRPENPSLEVVYNPRTGDLYHAIKVMWSI